MAAPESSAVTGAFGFAGKYITQRLLSSGQEVLTLTSRPEGENPFGKRVRVAPFDFDAPERLTDSLRGAAVLYNTYWIRFPRGSMTFERALENTRTLISAARAAGVRRVVHISITNPSEDSPLAYFRGKALAEKTIIESGISYAILRPTVLFGPEGILINNIAWLLRHLPIFAMPGPGDCRLQPVYVADLANLAVEAAARSDNVILDAVGPETFTFEELVQLIARSVGSRARIVHINPSLMLWLSRPLGWLLGDVILTREEILGLLSNLLVSDQPPTGRTRLSQWIEHRAAQLGLSYFSELARHYRRQ